MRCTHGFPAFASLLLLLSEASGPRQRSSSSWSCMLDYACISRQRKQRTLLRQCDGLACVGQQAASQLAMTAACMFPRMGVVLFSLVPTG
jgi:hypothetical protein